MGNSKGWNILIDLIWNQKEMREFAYKLIMFFLTMDEGGQVSSGEFEERNLWYFGANIWNRYQKSVIPKTMTKQPSHTIITRGKT